MGTDPQEANPRQLGYSLANVAEILIGCLDARGARSVLEIGPFRGELTEALLEWAGGAGARVAAIEPEATDELRGLRRRHPELELIEATSHEALPRIEVPDAVIIDGDHNHYTLSGELRLIGESAPGAELPLLMFHDICWPHERRDTYYAPERIPEAERQPLAHNIGLVPGDAGVSDAGIPFVWAAQREGGPRNGVLTAIEDFVAARERLRLAVVPLFFGFGVLWHLDAPWADAVARLVEPWDRNPVLARAEANRVAHLAAVFEGARDLQRERERGTRQAEVLRTLLGSKALALAERLSRLRRRGRPRISRQQVRDALGEDDEGKDRG